MTTFSQMVDSIMLESRRPDLKRETISYLNQAIRECFFDPNTQGVVMMRSAYNEAQLVAASDWTWVYRIPSPQTMIAIQAVRYDDVWRNGEPVYAKKLMPGRRLEQTEFAFMHAGDRMTFKGFGGVGSKISLAFYEFCTGLKYYEKADRPAEYDVADGWTYAPAYDVDDTTRAQAQALTSNWLLMGWTTLLEEGLRAKVFKRAGDVARQGISYSLWMQSRANLVLTERAELIGVV